MANGEVLNNAIPGNWRYRHEGKMYELRMLLVSGLHFVSIWLHAIDKGLSDAVIPTKPTPADLAGMRLYDEVEIIKLLHIAAKKAKERLDADDSELLGN
ncbi:hypothetical protein [Photorhabdus khanii]|uniref:hypothetical protein n=1 Tax=Photorhabdus khanii TaxID=1004150 RepID=UPI00105231DB|nr:hypothetical protein [Photorhabdus khanii]